MLTGADLLGIAQTGTGKTAAFVLPMIERLASGRAKARMPRSLDPEPDPRAGHPDRQLLRHLRQARQSVHGPAHRRGRHGRAVAAARARRRCADRDPGSPFGPVRARQGAARRRHDPGDRRGRSDARHGLHARRRADREPGQPQPADPDVLGDHAAGDSPPGGCLPHRPAGGPGDAAGDHGGRVSRTMSRSCRRARSSACSGA